MARTALLSLGFLVVLLHASPVSAKAGDVIEEAKSLLAKGDAYAAVNRLEAATAEASAEQLPQVLSLLATAYEQAAAKADSAGKTREAAHYREGRKLLDPPKTEDVPAPEPKPEAKPIEPESKPEIPVVEPPEAPKMGAEDLRRADGFWKSKDYVAAGKIYASLAKDNKLPALRNDHWAYCRLVTVLEKINANPKTPADWAEVHAEIDHIRVLAPKNWYGEYLRNVVVERSGGVRPAKKDAVVVRGAAPDEAPVQTLPSRTKSQVKTAPKELPREPESDPEIKPALAPRNLPDPEQTIGRPGPAQGNWQTFMTANFRIFHNDEALARKAAVKAETARRSATKLWSGVEPASPWTPKCDLYLYPTAEVFAAQTQQPRESPGFSTAGLEGGRVTARVVKLRADYAKMLDAVLPHEVTHIVLADLFPTQQIPRWADEGMAVLSEPASEQMLRARDLATPIRDDILFRLEVLMTAEYPGGNHWALYYAQSVSLTRYLVGLGTPRQFVEFVRASQTRGIEVALREIYSIEGIAQLETRWKNHTRSALNPATASASTSSESTTR
jgi:hypothetical protein